MALSDKVLCLCVYAGPVPERHYCCAKKTLWPGLVLCLPVAPRYVHAAYRLLDGRCRQALPRFPTFYECVSSDPSLITC
jgi:hypothetical protein